MIHKRNTRGFTLIELLVYMSLLGAVLVVLTDTFSSILQVRTESEATSAAQQDMSFIMSRFMYDIARATSVTVPASLGATGSSLQITVNGINYSYGLSGGNLTLTNNNGTQQLNGSDTTVSDLTFTRIGDGVGKDSVQVSFTVTSVAVRNSGPESRTLQTTIGLR